MAPGNATVPEGRGVPSLKHVCHRLCCLGHQCARHSGGAITGDSGACLWQRGAPRETDLRRHRRVPRYETCRRRLWVRDARTIRPVRSVADTAVGSAATAASRHHFPVTRFILSRWKHAASAATVLAGSARATSWLHVALRRLQRTRRAMPALQLKRPAGRPRFP